MAPGSDPKGNTKSMNGVKAQLDVTFRGAVHNRSRMAVELAIVNASVSFIGLAIRQDNPANDSIPKIIYAASPMSVIISGQSRQASGPRCCHHHSPLGAPPLSQLALCQAALTAWFHLREFPVLSDAKGSLPVEIHI